MITIRREKPTASQLGKLYLDAGWSKSPEKLDLQKSIDNSTLWIQAISNDELVGITRLQTDFVKYCCIYDLIVLKKYQNKGIGSSLMKDAIAFCEENKIRLIHLWPSKGKVSFYERFGFKALKNDQPTMIK
jgi:GNAT superfamily N-acetyltransferase